MFVVIEGMDGAGTTTQTARLVARLGERGIATHEPTDGPIGRVIRATLGRKDGAAAFSSLPWLFAADREDHLATVVEPALARGQVVVSDRYIPSSLAYQSLSKPLDFIWRLNERFRRPDLTVVLQIDAITAMARIERRGGEREVFEQQRLLEQISSAYETAFELLQRRPARSRWRIVALDATRPADELEAEIWRLVTDTDAEICRLATEASRD